MNFYAFHIGDYAADTAHLDPMEDLAYRRMLDLYYRTEKPLPASVEDIGRLVRLRDNLAAIRDVLNEFFTRTDDGWRHTRCDEEIARMQDKQAKARASAAKSVEARSANAQRTLNERSADVELPIPIPIPRPLKDLEPTALVVSAEPKRLPACPVDEIVSRYHQHLPMLPRVEVMSDGRRRSLASRWREVITDPDIRSAEDPKGSALEWWDWYFQHAAKSKFLTGKAKDWRADFDFLIAPRTFAKTVEGSYHKDAA